VGSINLKGSWVLSSEELDDNFVDLSAATPPLQAVALRSSVTRHYGAVALRPASASDY